MKKLVIIISILLSLTTLGQTLKPCPLVGESKKRPDQFSDSLKNRNNVSTVIENHYVDVMLKSGNDVDRFKFSSYVRVRGKITEVKHGGAELCNCHSNEKQDLDIHIVLSDSLGNGKIICEVNRYTQASDKTLNYADVHSMIGKQVYISGWLFFDGEHKQNATNTCVNCSNVWRTSCWEIHPVMKIEIIK
jgi:hypothetical protein